MSNRIFISYRHSDTEGAHAVDRLAHELRAKFGKAAVFYDEESLPAGHNWREHVTERLPRCEIVIAVIGPGWGEVTGDEDPIRFELELAQERGIPVLPVLVRGASMPNKDAFPESLQGLRDVIAVSIAGRGQQYRTALEQLFNQVEDITNPDDATKRADLQIYADTYEAFLTNDGVIDEAEETNLETLAERTHLTPEEVKRLEAEVKAKIDAQRRPGRSALLVFGVALFLSAVAILIYALNQDDYPARYVLTSDSLWMNTEPKGCSGDFKTARETTKQSLAKGEVLRGRFDEPACRNICWMSKDSKLELYEGHRSQYLARVIEGRCDDPSRNSRSAMEHEGWNARRFEPDDFECCAAGHEGFVMLNASYKRDWWALFDPPRAARPLEPKACRGEGLSPAQAALCTSVKLWGVEDRRVRLNARLSNQLSDRDVMAAKHTAHKSRFTQEREACSEDLKCLEASLRAEIHSIERFLQGRGSL